MKVKAQDMTRAILNVTRSDLTRLDCRVGSIFSRRARSNAQSPDAAVAAPLLRTRLQRPAWRFSTSLFLCAFAGAGNAECIDLHDIQVLELSGRLEFKMFAGPPNFTDVRKGDAPEPTYLLQLPDPICVTGVDSADPRRMFSTVQLTPSAPTASALIGLIKADVVVMLKEPMLAEPGHHHAPLIASVQSVSKAAPTTAGLDAGPTTARRSNEATAPDAAVATAPSSGEPSAQDVAATTVRGFYEALAAGSGSRAAEFVVPERRVGPFSPAAMTAFYGALPERLQVISVNPLGPNTVLVKYRFRSTGGTCRGGAVVSTVRRDGGNYISSIRAPDGC